jgi:hypothetical protein
MPGPVSDDYDPEFSTGENARMVQVAVEMMYAKLTDILDGKKPEWIVNIARRIEENKPSTQITKMLHEDEWRVLRFACERALESL